MFKDNGGYDRGYYEFKDMCREAWRERFNYVCRDMIENKNENRYHFFNENKNSYTECCPETIALRLT